MESLTKEYASPVCVCMQLRKAGRVVTQTYDRCLRPVGIRGTQFALLKRIACMRRPFRECTAYTLLYQFSPKDTGQSKVK